MWLHGAIALWLTGFAQIKQTSTSPSSPVGWVSVRDLKSSAFGSCAACMDWAASVETSVAMLVEFAGLPWLFPLPRPRPRPPPRIPSPRLRPRPPPRPRPKARPLLPSPLPPRGVADVGVGVPLSPVRGASPPFEAITAMVLLVGLGGRRAAINVGSRVNCVSSRAHRRWEVAKCTRARKGSGTNYISSQKR